MDVFQWDNRFETGLTEVDTQHQHLVAITNNFGTLIEKNGVRFEDLVEIFNELASYTQYHFTDEEMLMAEVGVDDRHVEYHVTQHHRFLQDVLDLHQEMATGGQEATEHVFTFLKDWLIQHILGIDMNLSRQIAAIRTGRSAGEAYEIEN